MKIALAQIKSPTGDLDGNCHRILKAYDQAAKRGVDLVVFPELALPGYPPRDLLERNSFVQHQLSLLDRLALATEGGPGMIVGYVEAHGQAFGKGLYNAAALIDEGRIVSRHFKSLLPTYDVFDELRYFDPAPEIQVATFRDKRLAITICEDFWNNALYATRRLYECDPIADLYAQHFDLMIHIAASPFSFGKREIKSDMFGAISRQYGTPLVHVNSVGASDGLTFDGWSNVWDADSNVVAQAARFAEDLIVWDSEEDTESCGPPDIADTEYDLFHALRLGLSDYIEKSGIEKVAIGLTGGVDSSVAAVLAVDAIGADRVVGVSMPSAQSCPSSVSDARELAERLGIEWFELPINDLATAFDVRLRPIFEGTEPGRAEENILTRIRGTLLMGLANKFNWLVLATGNKSEFAVGYCTLYGDMCGGLAVLGDVLKTQIWQLASWINRDGERIPEAIISKPPTVELRPNQLDSQILPDYQKLDRIIQLYVERNATAEEIAHKGIELKLAQEVIAMIDNAEHKRQQAPAVLRISQRAFDSGRRMPIVISPPNPERTHVKSLHSTQAGS